MPRLTKQEQADQVAGELDGRKCPNCMSSVIGHPRNGCVLQALIELLRDREVWNDETSKEQPDEWYYAKHANANVDKMWDDMGPIIDSLENGGYDEHK